VVLQLVLVSGRALANGPKAATSPSFSFSAPQSKSNRTSYNHTSIVGAMPGNGAVATFRRLERIRLSKLTRHSKVPLIRSLSMAGWQQKRGTVSRRKIVSLVEPGGR
jgi:hypothetical protein